ncbi:MAG: hypothetical protein MUC49_07920 [Raineya sp.]|jgi:hypothetical protein|nr:hypothetical protein [Raineya sp.]
MKNAFMSSFLKTNKLALIIICFIGCKNYDNKERYELSLKERIEIYYTTNSCCHYSVCNKTLLKHIKLIEEKTIKCSENEGGNCTGAFIFEGTSSGVDTVEIKFLEGSNECDSEESTSKSTKYIFVVK